MKGVVKMLSGIIDKNRYGNYVIRVDGHPAVQFVYYTKREAVRRYREMHNLCNRKIDFLDMSNRSYYMENGVVSKC